MSNLDDGQHTLIAGSQVVTMNATRDIIRNGAVLIQGDRIVEVGKASDIAARHPQATRVGGDHFVVTPGLVNTHIHITGEPLTRGYVPDDTPFEENVFVWLCQLYSVYTAAEERLSAQLAAVEMLKSGTTTFLEAGTIRFLDEVIDGLVEVGIRGPRRTMGVGPAARAWRVPAIDRDGDRAFAASTHRPEVRRQRSHRDVVDRRRPHHVQRSLVARRPRTGHRARSRDELSHVAGQTRSGRVHRRIRPTPDDPSRRDRRARRPMWPSPIASTSTPTRSGRWPLPDCSVVHCPTTALKVSYGVTQIGKMPEMVQAGINVSIGTDGNNASNYSDLHRATYLVAGLFKDARTDPQMFPAEMAYEMATLGGARTMLMENEIGSLEPGKKADVVLHDIDRPEWRPLLNVMNQLVWSADGRSVHTVFVDGRMVVDGGRMTTIDEVRCGPRRSRPARRSRCVPDCPTWPSSRSISSSVSRPFACRDYGSPNGMV